MKYIPANKLKTRLRNSIKMLQEGEPTNEITRIIGERHIETYNKLLSFIDSLQQEQPEDKQIVIITESHGDANIKWDCRSLSDVIALLKSAESFIAEKQIEKIAGPGSGPDYATTEGRYSHLFKHQQEHPEGGCSEKPNNLLSEKQEQPEVDLKKEIKEWADLMVDESFPEQDGDFISEEDYRSVIERTAIHFLGLNARKEDSYEST